MDTLLREILTSRVYEVARETPLDPAPRLSRRLANEILLKREDLQPIFCLSGGTPPSLRTSVMLTARRP